MKYLLILPFFALTPILAQGSIWYSKISTTTTYPSELGVTKVDFGLSEDQVLALYDATNGKVDFSGFVASNSPLPNTFFSEGPFFTVPPPFFFGPADPEAQGQWWLEALKINEAWTFATGKGVTIADCDSGFFIDEPDLKRNLLTEFKHDFSNPDNPDKVDDGNFIFHGTAVAAIMAGVLDGSGTNGISYNAQVVPLQNYNYDEYLDKIDKEEATAKCILHAIRIPNVKIIVLENQTSEGSSETFAGTREAVKLALEVGISVVSAAGNANLPLLAETKNDTGSIIVGAVRKNGLKAVYSNFGDRVTVGAFGEQLWTLFGPNGRMGNFNGTSGATPQVAAIVALMLEENPDLTPQQVRKILIQSRDVTDGNKTVGGIIDTLEALDLARKAPAFQTTIKKTQTLRARVMEILN